MKGDLILRMIISFFIPFLLLYGFFSIASYKTMGFYSLAIAMFYFMLVYIFSFLKNKTITSKNLKIFEILSKVMLVIFLLFLFYILMILLNFNIPIIL